MKIKIVSDGTHGGTEVVNADTGERIDNITSVEWGIAAGGVAFAKIWVVGVPADLLGQAKLIQADSEVYEPWDWSPPPMTP